MKANEGLEKFWRNWASIPQIKGKDIQKVIQRKSVFREGLIKTKDNLRVELYMF